MATDHFRRLVVLCMILWPHSLILAQTGPNFCTYADGLYTCDYSSMGSSDRPVDYTGFTTEPQNLLVKVNGFLPFFGDSQTFSSTFSGIDSSQFDPNYPASLLIDCGYQGSVFIDSGAFYNMSHVQWFKIRNCEIFNLGLDTVDAFQKLDYFGIENGVIDTVAPDAFSGLTVEKLTTASHQFPRLQGRFEIMNAKFLSGSVSPGMLFYFKNLTSIALQGSGLTSISGDTFRYTTQLTRVDVSDNFFTGLPDGLFRGLDMLSEVRAFNIQWDCACASLWWVETAQSDNITFLGDLVCSTGGTVGKYYNDNCYVHGPCAGQTGVASGQLCQSISGILIFVLSLIALCCVCSAFVLMLLVRRTLTSFCDGDDVTCDDTNDAEIAGKSDDLDDVDDTEAIPILTPIQRWQKATRRIIEAVREGIPTDNILETLATLETTTEIEGVTRVASSDNMSSIPQCISPEMRPKELDVESENKSQEVTSTSRVSSTRGRISSNDRRLSASSRQQTDVIDLEDARSGRFTRSHSIGGGDNAGFVADTA